MNTKAAKTAETARQRGRKTVISFTTALSLCRYIALTLLLLGSTAWALPQDGTVAVGSSTITQPDAGTMRINQTTDKSIINWQGYSIGANEKVQYFQPNTNSISLNRVTGADPSLIYGQLSANGQVWVINPNGLLVGQNAKINVGGFLASTLNINDNDFINGNYNFSAAARQSGSSITAITNYGNINANDGGYVVFISPTINNSGNITANNGSVNMASGDDVTLTFANNGLINLVINKQTAAEALGIDNSGTITADGGQVIISAQTAGDLLKTVINNTGVIQARTISNQNGVIKLLGGMENNAIKVGGTLDASAPNNGDGGFIETSAASVKVADGAIITTAAPNGKTGTWLIDPTDYNIAASGGDITGAALSTNLGATSVTILSSSGATAGSGDINVNDAVSWSANTLTLTAARDININAVMTASGTSALAMNTATANGVDAAVAGGTVKVGLTGSGFTGRVDFGARSGTGFLTINGNGYTVINSLGAAGSVTGADLQGMSGNLAGRYALGSNIDATATSTWNAGAGFLPVGDLTTQFTGTFDGLGHTITGLTINRPTSSAVGLFGYTNSSTIRNIGLAGGAVSGGIDSAGGLAGYNIAGTISNSYSTGSVTGINGTSYVGGLVGYNPATAAITNSYSTGSVTGYSGYAGGLAGDNLGTISNSYATGSVTGSGTTYSVQVGGLAGVNWYGTISNSYATGSVTGSATTFAAVAGGLVGWNYFSTINNSYATGTVSGKSSVGGLVGQNTGTGTINNTYATGAVTGSGNSIGGLVGQNLGTITNSYATGAVTGTTFVGGLAGYNTGTITSSYWDTTTSGQATSAGGTGLTTAQMMQSANFTGFDFTNVWWLSAGNTRPFLRSEWSNTITNAHQLQLMSMNATTLAASYTLGADINMAELSQASGLWNTTTGFVPVGNLATGFTGAFDGLGHTINSLTINRPTTDYIGLFGYTSGATIRNVGLVGGSVSGNNEVGGLVGYNGGNITNSYSTGSIGSTGFYVGGLVGYNSGTGAITNSYSTGSIGNTGFDVGGLVGGNSGTITSSYSTGNVISSTGLSVGGLVGNNYGGTITSSYWDTQTSGLVTSAGGTGLTTSQMKQQASFTGWDISNSGGSSAVWRIYEGHTYPLLRNFLTPLTLTGAPDVTVTYNGSAQSGGAFTLIPNVLGAAATGTNAGFYNGYYSTQQGYDITGGNLTINPATLTLLNIAANNASKTYGAALTFTGAEFTPVGLAGGDTISGVTLTSAGTVATANAGAYAITPSNAVFSVGSAGNYNITYVNGVLTVNPAPLTITGVVANNKVYDGTTTATLSNNGTLSGLVGAETLTLNTPASVNFSDKNAATGKTITASGYTISDGTGLSSNYQLVSSSATTTADVTAAALTVTAATNTKTYNADTTAAATPTITAGTLYGADTANFIETYDTKNAGTGKTLTASGTVNDGNGGNNYTYTFATDTTGVINPAPLTVTANAASKTYDGAAYTGGNGVGYGGFVNGETSAVLGGALAYGGTSQGAINAGSYAITPSGLTSGNYAITFNNGSLTVNPAPLSITGATANNKIYDGATTATLSNNGALSGLIGIETLTLNAPTAINFVDKNAGIGKTVTASGYTITNGTGLASNYQLASNNAITTAEIMPAALTVTGAATAQNKVYDGNTTATAVITGVTLSGIIGLDNVTISGGSSGGGGSFADKNVGLAKPVTAALTLAGTDAGNYTLIQPTGLTADITPAALTITGAVANNKIYDGTTTATLSNTGSLSGLIGGETLTLNAPTAINFADKNAGGKTVTASGYTIADGSGLASNYQLVSSSATTTAYITAAALTVTGVTAQNKVYDGATTTVITGATLSGVIGLDTVTISGGGNFADKNVGAAKSVTATLALTGADAGNYALASNSATTTADITPATLTPVYAAYNKAYDAATTAPVAINEAASGVVIGDTVNFANTAANFSDKNAGVGKTVTITGIGISGADAGNYTLASNSAKTTADITPTPLTITANAASKTYDGAAYSGGNGVGYGGLFVNSLVGYYGGFVNGETSAVLGGTLTYGGTSQGAINAGSYTITPSGLTSGNYAITYNNGALTVNPAPLTITANVASKTYNGLAYSGGNGVSYTGLVNGETSAVLGGALTYGGTSQGAINAGSYVITPSGQTSGNYNIAYANGVLTVRGAPVVDYINVIKEGLGNSGGSAGGQTEQPAKYGTAYASAESPVFTFTQNGLMPLIKDERTSEKSKSLCLIVKKDGNPAILDTECK